MTANRRAGVAAAIVLVVYLATGAKDIVFGDGLEFCTVAATGGVAHPPGYPLYTLLLRGAMSLAPASAAYFAGTVLNSLLGALTAFLAGVLCEQLLRDETSPALEAAKPWLPACATLLAGFSLALWSASTLVEVYALNAALTMGTIVLSAQCSVLSAGPGWDRRFVGACVLCGLIAANHLPGMAIFLLLAGRAIGVAKTRPRSLVALGLVIVIPALLYGSLLLRPYGYRNGIFWGGTTTLPALLAHIHGGEYAQYQFLHAAPGHAFTLSTWLEFAAARLGQSFALLDSQLGLRALFVTGLATGALFAVGALRLWKRDRVLCVGCAGAAFAQVAFVFLYNIPDFADYLLGILACASPLLLEGLLGAMIRIGGALGYDKAPEHGSRIAALLAIVAVLAALGNFGASSHRGDDFARRWTSRALDALPQNALLLTHGDADTFALWYSQHVDRKRRDVLVYACNFHRFPWYARSIPAENPLRGAVSFDLGPPPMGLEAYLAALDRLVIDPVSGHARIFSTLPEEPVWRAWKTKYSARVLAPLLSDAEIEAMLDRGPRGIPPALLLELNPTPAP